MIKKILKEAGLWCRAAMLFCLLIAPGLLFDHHFGALWGLGALAVWWFAIFAVAWHEVQKEKKEEGET